MSKRGDHGAKAKGKTGREAPTRETSIHLRFQGDLIDLEPTPAHPIHVLLTGRYEAWIDGFIDPKTNARITGSVDKMRRGLLGDWKEVGEGVFELRLDFGPGYRVYYAKYGAIVIVLLGGGDKSEQDKDIAAAQHLWGELKHEITEV